MKIENYNKLSKKFDNNNIKILNQLQNKIFIEIYDFLYDDNDNK